MPLIELLPTVSQLSHQDKLRLIHFLLLAVAKEEGCSLETAENSDFENALLNQLASRGAIVIIPEEADLDDRYQAEVLADFRQAWHEAMTGQTISVAQLWEGLEDV